MRPEDFQPIYCAFYTVGTIYEQEAARLRASLDALRLPHDIVGVDSVGDWAANASMTAAFCVKMLSKHFHRPVITLDADAVVRQFPKLFYELDGVDIAAHWLNGAEFLNGTVYWGKGPIAASIARRYEQLVIGHGGKHKNEQTLLELAILDHRPGVKLEKLPASYCYIADANREKLADDQIVIQHMQASREAHCEPGSKWLEHRKQWIASVEAA